MVSQRSRQTEDQVVPRLVGEQERFRTIEELRRIGELDDLHEFIL